MRSQTLTQAARLLAASILPALATCASAAPQADKPVHAIGVYEPWQVLDQKLADASLGAHAFVRPAGGRQVLLDVGKIQSQLTGAPLESANLEFALQAAPIVIAIPKPDGSFERFEIVESPVYEPGFEAEFPDIKTYRGDSLDSPGSTIRCDMTPLGFRAQVLSPEGSYWLDPVTMGDINLYTTYAKSDLIPTTGWTCHVHGTAPEPELPENPFEDRLVVGPTRRTYRIAVAATGEYTAYFGGTVAKGQAAIVTAINRVTQVYEKELNIRLTLISNNSTLVYTSASSDPYSNYDADALLDQNQAVVNSKIGAAWYDIGHVFSTGGGGLASFGVVCNNSYKAQGETGSSNPTGDAFYIDYVAHEIGHQFGADHTFNSETGSCQGNRAASSAFEPGSGSTIMAYAGICDADDLQNHSDPYFHAKSFHQIITYVSSKLCHVATSTGNSAPTISGGSSTTIPRGTPYALTASGGDANGDALTFCWEMYLLGSSQGVTGGNFPDTGSNGAFQRSFNPITSNVRQIPINSKLLTNTLYFGETLPQYSRVLAYRVTARDGKGGVNVASLNVTVTSTSGPFLITSQNSAVSWAAGSTQTVTWDVANTTAAPVNASKVDILFAADGANFATTIASGLPNNGSATFTVPYVPTTTGRIKVKGNGRIFFDINNANITITGTPPVPTSPLATPAKICPGGTVTLSVATPPINTAIDWYTSSCGGTLVGTGKTLVVSPTTTTNYFARTRNLSNSAVSPCAQVSVTVDTAPVAPTSATSSKPNVCQYQPGTLTLSVTGGSGTTLRWLLGSCTGTLVGTGNNLVIPVPTKTTTYFARYETTCGNSACVSTTVTFKACKGDLNCDGSVDDDDFSLFITAYDLYGCTQAGMPTGCPADFVRNGFVDDDDFVQFIISYNLVTCP